MSYEFFQKKFGEELNKQVKDTTEDKQENEKTAFPLQLYLKLLNAIEKKDEKTYTEILPKYEEALAKWKEHVSSQNEKVFNYFNVKEVKDFLKNVENLKFLSVGLKIMEQLSIAALEKDNSEETNQEKGLYTLLAEAICEINTQKFRGKIGKSLTKEEGGRQYGRSTIFNNEKKSEYRSYKNDREKQILRHISTQIYLWLQYNKAGEEKLDEVQTMHIHCNEKNNLFIVANNTDITKMFLKTINKENFEQLLTWFYFDKNKKDGKEGTERSKRYALKLKNRVFSEKEVNISGSEPEDVKNAQSVGEILRRKKIFSLKIKFIKSDKGLVLKKDSKKLLKQALNEENNIYFINIKEHTNKYKQRHSEEFLCDIVEYAKILDKTKNFHASIAGKKRPCMGCYGRMDKEKISNFGKNPGRFYMNTIEMQPNDLAANNTLKLLFNRSSYVSLNRDKSASFTGYDSGSTSEEDVEIYSKNKMEIFQLY